MCVLEQDLTAENDRFEEPPTRPSDHDASMASPMSQP
jgi:hypothetical protein